MTAAEALEQSERLDEEHPFQRHGRKWRDVLAIAAKFQVPDACADRLGQTIQNAAFYYFHWLFRNANTRDADHERVASNYQPAPGETISLPIAELRGLHAALLQLRAHRETLDDPVVRLRLNAGLNQAREDRRARKILRPRLVGRFMSAMDDLKRGLDSDELFEVIELAARSNDRNLAGWGRTWWEIEEAVRPLEQFWTKDLDRPLKPRLFEKIAFGSFATSAMFLIDPALRTEQVQSTLRRMSKNRKR